MKITALTSCCVDFFPEQGEVYVGGNSLNFATQCKISGINDVTVIGAIGKDDFGTLIEQHFDKYQIDRSHIYRIDNPTASNKIFINKEGDRYFKEDSWNGGAFDIFRLTDYDWKQVEKSDIIAMPAGDPNLIDLLNKRNDSQMVVIDYMDYFTLDVIENMIEKVDVIFLSTKEDMLDEINMLAKKRGRLIVATLGANGSVAFWNDSSYFHKAIEVQEIVDTTGCGDAFQAAFTIEFFKSRDINEALKIGSVAASKVLAYMGGVE